MVKLKDLEKYKGNTYKLIDVLDYNLVSKVEDEPMYKGIVNYTTKCIRERNFGNDKFAVRIEFAFNTRGEWTNKNIRTSMVSQIVEKDNLFKIYTANSIYVFEPAEKPVPVYQDAAELIELYINDEMNCFCKGFYYDENKQPEELFSMTHLGMVVDSCLICTKEGVFFSSPICRYFIRNNGVEFYDTLYNQQDYSTKMLIHNTADVAMTISFEFSDVIYEIAPGESVEFYPPEHA